MSLTKKFLKSKPVCKVTFRLPAEQAGQAESASVLGDFNNWDPTSGSMKRQKNGDFSVTLDLGADAAYHFRYLLDGQQWENDAEADGFEKSPLGDFENSVVRV